MIKKEDFNEVAEDLDIKFRTSSNFLLNKSKNMGKEVKYKKN